MDNYYYLKLADKKEAAALIAALSRFLNYPHGETFLTEDPAPQAWWHPKSITLAFNTTSRAAVVHEFGDFPYTLGVPPNKANGFCNLFKKDIILPMGIDEAILSL